MQPRLTFAAMLFNGVHEWSACETPKLITEMNDRSREVFRRVVEGYLGEW